MSSYAAAAGQIAVHDKTLAANAADTVTFADDLDRVEVLSDGAANLYFRVDGGVPTVAGPNTYKLPAGVSSGLVVSVPTAGGTVVQLISPGAATYSVVNAGSY